MNDSLLFRSNLNCLSHSHRVLLQVYEAEYVSLHVRRSNRAAFNLYTETLGYKIHDVEAKYYADGEDAYDMRKHLKGKQNHGHGHHHHHGGGCCSGDAKAVETAQVQYAEASSK